ncbi:hypothetical protein PMAYCL1PPCAC_06919, partial [Pristionchus mayeri]
VLQMILAGASTSDVLDQSVDLDSPSKRGWSHQMKEIHRETKVHQRIIFARLVHKHRKILFGTDDGSDRMDGTDPLAKEGVWKWIAEQVKDLDTFKGKGWSRLRDHDWQYIRRHAVTRYENNSIAAGPLGELDQIVIECINRNIHPLCDPPRVSISSNAPSSHFKLDSPLMESIGVKEDVPSTMDTLLASTEEAASREEKKGEIEDANLVSSLLSFIKAEPSVSSNLNTVPPSCSPLGSTIVVPNGGIASPDSPSERPKRRKRSEVTNGSTNEWMSSEEHEAEMRRLERKKKEIEIWMMERDEKRREAMHSLEMEHKRLQIDALRRSLK